jgi:flagellar protein FliO/FliZ
VARVPASPVDETTLALDDPAAGTAGNAANVGSSSIVPYFLRMVLVLGLVIAALYGLFALLKRASRFNTTPDTYLRVLASVSIATGRSVHVVALGDKAWLLGSTDSSVNLISAVDDKEVVDALVLRAAASPETPGQDFLPMLLGSLGKKGARKANSTDASEFFNRQRDRLKRF